MKEQRDCKIVQDLLPNYIEKLTNEETNNYIEEHLKECNECKIILENMKKDLNINDLKKEKREIKYIKKYSKKLRLLELIIIIILIIALGAVTYYYFFFRDNYFKTSKQLYETLLNGRYPDTFYATIEEISVQSSLNECEMKIKGLSINDINHRGEFYFYVPLDNLKIKWNETDIDAEQLKTGQTVIVYNYSDTSELGELSDVKMIVVLDDNL